MRAYFALYNQRPGLSSRSREATGLAARRRQSRVLRPAIGPARTPAAPTDIEVRALWAYLRTLPPTAPADA